ncbi:putative F-box protein [Namao virus]|nr:putative F-box protein [Namao virus]
MIFLHVKDITYLKPVYDFTMWSQIPFDIFLIIVKYLDISDLIKCHLICLQWYSMVSRQIVWKRRQPCPVYEPRCWKTYSVLHKKAHNLIDNPNSVDDMNHWSFKTSQFGRWISVNTDKKTSETGFSIPDSNIFTYFVCVSGHTAIFQTVDLFQKGYGSGFLDHVRPDVFVEFWYALEQNNRCRYTYCIEVISEDMKILDRICVSVKLQTLCWNLASHRIKDYPSGIRYIHISHIIKCRINTFGIGITGHKLLLKYPQRDKLNYIVSDFAAMFEGALDTKGVCYDYNPSAVYRCISCNKRECDKKTCLQYKCHLTSSITSDRNNDAYFYCNAKKVYNLDHLTWLLSRYHI